MIPKTLNYQFLKALRPSVVAFGRSTVCTSLLVCCWQPQQLRHPSAHPCLQAGLGPALGDISEAELISLLLPPCAVPPPPSGQQPGKGRFSSSLL